MAIIKCKMCGGDIELAADKTYGMCEFCGSTMTLPKLDDDQRAAAFNRGNHFRRIGEFDKALAVYERIVREDDTDAEAHWCCALCRFGIEYVEDPATYEYLPTCHRASFDSFLEDVDYLAAVENSEGITKRQYQKDGAKIAEVQRGILATSQNEEPFDVFICYKESDENGERTRDSLMAQDVYYQLTDHGYRVFFARITLEDMVGKQYEPYIFAALNSAKVMIVIGTKAEYMNAVWVKNEWSRFLAMMKKDRHKLLLPCYRDMDPYDMPEQLSVLQSYDMSKIGFIQDLIRGIKKVLDADKKPEVVQETVVVQQPANSSIIALLKRGNLALEDTEWEKADQFFEEVLNQNAECVDAYIGKFMTDEHISNKDAIITCVSGVYNNSNFQKAMRFANTEQKLELKKYFDQNVSYLLEQAEDALVNYDWGKARRLYKIIQRQSTDCAQAYVGEFLATEEAQSLNELARVRIEKNEQVSTEIRYLDLFSVNDDNQKLEEMRLQEENAAIEKYTIPLYLPPEKIKEIFAQTQVEIHSAKACRQKQLDNEIEFWDNCAELKNALKYGDSQIRDEIAGARKDAVAIAEERLQKVISEEEALEADVFKVYEIWIEKTKSKLQRLHKTALSQQERICGKKYEQAYKLLRTAKTADDLKKAKALFVSIRHYSDSEEKIAICRKAEEGLAARTKRRNDLTFEMAVLMSERSQLGLFATRRKQEIDQRLYEIRALLDQI